MRRRTLIATAPLALAACVPAPRYLELEQAYQQLQGQYSSAEAQIQMLQGQLRVTMQDRILFPEGGYTITERSRRELQKLVPTLQGLRQTRVTVVGYTDNLAVGPELRRMGISSNLDLSSRRADTVADTLIRLGTPRNIISAEGRGDANPIASNATAEGRAQNRRIEVTLIGPGS
jgi:flagellar motor protein MotB